MIKAFDFYADWCNPCKSLAPTLDKVLENRDIELVKVNIEDDEKELSFEYGIRNIPTVVAVNVGENGETKEIGRFTGTKTETELNKFFDNLNN